MKLASKFAKIAAGVTLAAFAVTGLTACSSVSFDKDNLVKANVTAIECPTGTDERQALVDDLQETADFVANASPKQTSDILKLNEGLTSLKPLSAALSNKIEECAAPEDTEESDNSGKSKDDSKKDDDTKLTDAEIAKLIKALTVSTIPASAECKTDVTVNGQGYVDFAIASLEGTPPRMWPASIGMAFTSTDPVQMRVELQQAICKDPLLGVAWLTFMATDVRDAVLAATSMDMLELTPRLKVYTDVSRIKAKATAFVPLLNVKDPTKAQLEKGMKQNVAWQQDAALVNTLIERFATIGVEARQSVVQYELYNWAGATSLSDVRIAAEPEGLPALIFAITVKGQCDELVAFGANTGDMRPELFKPKDCTPPPTETGCEATNSCYVPTCEDTGTCYVPCVPGTPGCPEKTQHVPGEQDLTPAPSPTTTAAPPEKVNTEEVKVIDTKTDLPKQDKGPVNNGLVSE